MITHRASWDECFMRIAEEVASRATCDRKHVGAVIVRDKSILATGYNGSIRGLPHCDEDGHLMEDGHCVRTIHAEANAIIQAARNGVRIEGATIYVTASPCWPCFCAIAQAGIVRIVHGEPYRESDPGPQRVRAFAGQIGIELVAPGVSSTTADDRRLTPDHAGWDRAWGIMEQRHGDVSKPDEAGERWQYMDTFEGEHEFRHRGKGRDTVRELDGDFEGCP